MSDLLFRMDVTETEDSTIAHIYAADGTYVASFNAESMDQHAIANRSEAILRAIINIPEGLEYTMVNPEVKH